MALLATYTNAGAASLAGGANCFAHGLPTTPDWATFIPIMAGSASVAASSIPIHLVSRGATAIVAFNANGASLNAEAVFQFVHSIIR